MPSKILLFTFVLAFNLPVMASKNDLIQISFFNFPDFGQATKLELCAESSRMCESLGQADLLQSRLLDYKTIELAARKLERRMRTRPTVLTLKIITSFLTVGKEKPSIISSEFKLFLTKDGTLHAFKIEYGNNTYEIFERAFIKSGDSFLLPVKYNESDKFVGLSMSFKPTTSVIFFENFAGRKDAR